MSTLVFKKNGIQIEKTSTTDSNHYNAKPSATEAILKGCEAAPGKNFTEKLWKVLEIWPELAHEWYRER